MDTSSSRSAPPRSLIAPHTGTVGKAAHDYASPLRAHLPAAEAWPATDACALEETHSRQTHTHSLLALCIVVYAIKRPIGDPDERD